MLFNNSHSAIICYPIDEQTFPLVKKSKLYKIELTKDEIITIPSSWYHWIYTEPNTLSISYQIKKISFKDTNNDFYKSFINSNPFKRKLNSNININYNNFINNSLKLTYKTIFSETNDVSPVIKNKTTKFFYKTSLSNIIYINEKKKYYTYVGNANIEKNNLLYNLSNINFILDNEYDFIDYKASVWFTIDKQVNSGLHNDPENNILYIVDGKKTIYLFSPDSYDNLYIQEYELIKTIN
jgi:hypothetical protein